MEEGSIVGGIVDDTKPEAPLLPLEPKMPREAINGSNVPETYRKPKKNFNFSKQSKNKEKSKQQLSIFSKLITGDVEDSELSS